MTLDDSLTTVKGIGPRRAADLERVGLRTVGDLISRFPLRYEDRARFRDIAGIRPGELVTIAGTVASSATRLTRRPGFKIFDALIRDATGAIRAVWLNQPFMARVMRQGSRVVLYGQVDERRPAGLQMTGPQYELAGEDENDSIHTGRIVPIYEKAGAVTGRIQRRLMAEVMRQLPESRPELLPQWLELELELPRWRVAIAEAHFPPPDSNLEQLNAFRSPAQLRLIVEEFFCFQLGLLLRRREADAEPKPSIAVIDDRVREAIGRVVPFPLTAGQEQAFNDIVNDLVRPQAMHRLLQGDVGAGKTIVALMAAVIAMENGLQAALMAPTEVLAEQHFLTIRRMFEAAPYRVVLLTGSTAAAQRRRTLEALASGHAQLVVGTHALVQQAVAFHRLGLVVIDEQHRFGVMQRAVLREKGWRPDVLVMTATPIPRTLALSAYGDLDVSTIRELPPGRTPVRTVARPQSARDEVYAFARRQLDAGRQIYIVYPLVEESAKVDVRAATEAADHLAAEVFPEYRVGLLHGRLSSEEKDHVMRAVASGDIQVLVSTTVIEVGIDVANATLMIVEHAERFGLSQLHQLRGRVGRGPHPSYCALLFQAPLTGQGRERLDALVETSDGFVIAERDLALRGPGDFFGTRQSGAPTLRAGDLMRDHELMEQARRYAAIALDRDGSTGLIEEVRRSWGHRFGLAGVG